LDVNITVPETTCPQAGFVVVESVEDGEPVEDREPVEDVGSVAVFVNCVCAIASVGCIVNAPNAAKETIVATMYDIVVRFIHRTLGDKLFM
jgi:hypothetical protein